MARKAGGGGNKGEVNKSKVIRDYKAAHADEGPTAISKALTEQGLDVSPAFVSAVLLTERKKAGAPVGPSSRGGNDQVSIKVLKAAKALAEESGGVAKAKAILEKLSDVL